MPSRSWLGIGLLLAACQLPQESPPAAAPPPPPSSNEPAPLPPEEMPPPDDSAAAEPPPAPAPVEPGITATGAPTRGTLPQDVVNAKLKSASPAIQACYERGLKTKPDLRGSLTIHFVVAPDGKVAHADAAEGDEPFDDAPTVECILAEIKKLEFPKPSGGRVFLNYPLRLEPPKP